MCLPAPVATRLWGDVHGRWPSTTFLGIVGDQAHQARTSGHNCGSRQESALGGVGYDDAYAHALDIGHGGNRTLAAEIRGELLKDPRTRYVIDNGVGYYPAHRGGGTFNSSGHTTHLHWSAMPGTTFDTRPFFGRREMPAELRERLQESARQEAQRRPVLEVTRPVTRGEDVRDVQRLIGAPVTGRYGRGAEKRVKAVQQFFGLTPDGVVGPRTWEIVLFVAAARFLGY